MIRLEGHGFNQDEVVLSRDMYLLQVCLLKYDDGLFALELDISLLNFFLSLIMAAVQRRR